MKITPLQVYKNLSSGHYYRVLTVARIEETNEVVVVYQVSDDDDLVMPIEEFKKKFEHKAIDYALCKAPGCSHKQQGFYPYCKQHGSDSVNKG